MKTSFVDALETVMESYKDNNGHYPSFEDLDNDDTALLSSKYIQQLPDYQLPEFFDCNDLWQKASLTLASLFANEVDNNERNDVVSDLLGSCKQSMIDYSEGDIRESMDIYIDDHRSEYDKNAIRNEHVLNDVLYYRSRL